MPVKAFSRVVLSSLSLNKRYLLLIHWGPSFRFASTQSISRTPDTVNLWQFYANLLQRVGGGPHDLGLALSTLSRGLGSTQALLIEAKNLSDSST